ncbi:carboxylesterase/lipase family protein [Terracidiphilus gabretensis]|uniref:carboxylesterase/lipase family protein n=1 Tax=Terracidiphilus gabretensis TaxID=1577687 RepID=UPI00071C0225|nr:carboxylesterase family protein [Terracidiphilus gabretensis]
MHFGSRMLRASAAAALLTLSSLAHADSLTIKTEQGKVHGKTLNDGKVNAWLGLPYAAPPVNDLRWKAPQQAAKWPGERDGTKFGAHCAQNHVFDDMIFQDNGDSEDCLFLNVYAPANATAKSKLPVMFWIHGGGFSGGGSNEPRHNGDFLPLKGVVLITINYRLGVFGFLASSDLAKETSGTAGNYGLMDMIAALRWTKANIKEFGGDPDNVTIFGESAGSFAVSTLMVAPPAKGLFQKAIGESGGALGTGALTYEPLTVRATKDDKWVATLNVNSLADLRALPAATILAAVKPGVNFPPNIDGKVVVEPIAETYAIGNQFHVPLLAGWNSDEGSFVAMRGTTVDQYKAYAATLFKDKAPNFLKLYPADNDAQALRSAIDYGSDTFIALSTWRWIEAHRKTGQSPVYRYHFELAALPSKFHPETYAFHSDDIEYVFGTLDTRPGETVRPEDRTLSDQMMTYWTNFAKTGDPNGPGVPAWPKYNDASFPLIHLNSTITSGPDQLRARYEFLEANPVPPAFR